MRKIASGGSQLVRTDADGLKTTPIGRWALDKYRLVSLYSHLFSTGMKNRWSIRVYVDLCAGPGFSHVEGTAAETYYGSPLLALNLQDPFSKYVFCESDEASLDALRKRVKRLFPAASVDYIAGNYDEKIADILASIPNGNSVLSLCYGDPFDLSIKFDCIQRLAVRRMDFLLLLALNMDAQRALIYYLRSSNRKVDEFLGMPDWRDRWAEAEANGLAFPQFLAESFGRQMEKIGYLSVPFYKMKLIRADSNQPLYHLALFSKHERAYEFWDEVRTYSTDQRNLGF